MTKTPENPYPLGPHIVYSPYKAVPPGVAVFVSPVKLVLVLPAVGVVVAAGIRPSKGESPPDVIPNRGMGFPLLTSFHWGFPLLTSL